MTCSAHGDMVSNEKRDYCSLIYRYIIFFLALSHIAR
jgi:hypothetical protein